MGYMTRRTFVELGAIAGGFAALSGLAGCGSTSQASPASSAASSFAESAESVESASSSSASSSSASSSSASSASASSEAPQVYFARALDSAGLQAVFAVIGRELGSGKIGVKLSSGEPGGNHYLKGDLIADLVHAVGGTIVECNTAYGGGRSSIAAHYQVAADHGFTAIADFLIMDEAGSLSLPVVGGLHLSEDLVGAAFSDYDGFLILSHFKGHMMAGFGGALKNISIGMASREGKYLIHSAGATSESWRSAATPDFLESMADPVALDQACVDLVYASEDDSADLIKRMESRDGVHVLEAAESLGVGSRAYELVEIG